MSYRFNEGSLDVPDDWHDETMNIFKGPERDGYNLVISRDRIPKAVEPEAHVAEQLLAIEENLPMFAELERSVIELDGQSLVWLEYTWKSPEGLMNQVNVLRVVGEMLVSFTFTSAKGFDDAQRAELRTVLESYRGPQVAR
jgi:hypothetical protein